MSEQEKAYRAWATNQVPGTVTGLDIWNACSTWHEQNMLQKSQNNDTSTKHVAGKDKTKTEQRLAEIEARHKKTQLVADQLFICIEPEDLAFLLALVRRYRGALEFYSAEGTWIIPAGKGDMADYLSATCPAQRDCGGKARQALEDES